MTNSTFLAKYVFGTRTDLIVIRQFYSQIKMQERRRADWTENKRDISKCKSCLGSCCSKVQSDSQNMRSDSFAQLNNLNLGDDKTDIDTAFNRWLTNIEKHQRPSWVERFVQTFMVRFSPDQVHIIDGENMAHNAQEGRI